MSRSTFGAPGETAPASFRCLLPVFSIMIYNKKRQREEHKASLEQHRNRLWILFQEEKNQLEAEHRQLLQDRKMQRRH